MYLRQTILLFILSLAVTAEAYELIVIQAVSNTKKTFVTRNGKRQGIMAGMTGTFTAEDVSLLAKAVQVTGSYTQWEISNPEAIMPFEKGAVVTYYPATEHLWALSPETERRKYIKSLMPHDRRSLVFKGALTRGISESVSEASPSVSSRGGYMTEIYFEKDFHKNFAFDVGFRYDREVVNYPGASLITVKTLIIGDIIYYFDTFREHLNGGRIYVGGGVGYGKSDTSTIGVSQSGIAIILPTIKLGMSLPFNETWEFLLDNAFESLRTNVEQDDGSSLTTTQTNYKIGFGLRRFF